ncbi:DUF2304 domain-containing protein [Agromyces sp. H66]|uniref:DUF2304 domain-containing protein n=1 Tax=Agromyces sp. H66 TaxID=2529859 RepID=UPI0010AACC6F|nr:DUF2304 domain-containing protein [Agromyces sp. H66]
MSLATYILGIVAALFVLIVVIEMLRQRRLRERHAVWWLAAGIIALVVGIFPQLLGWAAQLIGVEVPTNLVFFLSAAVLFLVGLQHSSELTTLEAESQTLAEELSLLRLRVESLERRLEQTEEPSARPDRPKTD